MAFAAFVVPSRVVVSDVFFGPIALGSAANTNAWRFWTRRRSIGVVHAHSSCRSPLRVEGPSFKATSGWS
jgi:hypothetical protein